MARKREITKMIAYNVHASFVTYINTSNDINLNICKLAIVQRMHMIQTM